MKYIQNSNKSKFYNFFLILYNFNFSEIYFSNKKYLNYIKKSNQKKYK